MKKQLIFISIILFSLIPSVYAANDFAYNRLYEGSQPIDGFNYSINVNSSENWNTDIGSLSTVNATQMSNQGGVLNIIESWVDSLWCRLTGCTMSGNINMGNNNISNVGHLQVNGDGNFTGTLFAKDLNLTSPASINFLDVDNFIARLFAQEIMVGNITRNILATDANTFAINTNHDGTTFIANINTNPLANTSAGLSLSNSDGNGMSLLKFNSNGSNQEEGFLGNNMGNLKITNQNQNDSNLTLGFNDGTIRKNVLGDLIGVFNQTDVIVLNNKFATIPFLTNFFFPVIFRNDTTIDADLNVTGNITGNDIYGYAKMKNESGVLIDLITVGVFENITGINNGSKLNGVSYDGDHAFTIDISGTYETSASVTFVGASATDYNFDIFVNGIIQDIFAVRQITTPNAEASISLGPYALELNEEDFVTLGVSDGAPPTDPTIIGVQFGLRRIGD